MPTCLRTILWRNDPSLMYEYCALQDTGSGFRFEGVTVLAEEGMPMRITYAIEVDRDGLTRSVTVDAAGGRADHHLRLDADDQRAWRLNGVELPECRGFSDVDLGFSPSTNSLAIRRLNLNPGESCEITVTWVRFPEFDVVPFPQRYTRLADGRQANRYLFESLTDDFKAELVVDELGIVRQYGEFWQAAAVGQEC